jgi:hypothetical protein
MTVQMPTIVCLCGSGRFLKAFEEAEERETLNNKIVLTIGVNTKDVARSAELQPYKDMLDYLHLRKIDLADEILVINIDGYIGESTVKEIVYAKATNKRVRLLHPTIDLASRLRLADYMMKQNPNEKPISAIVSDNEEG